MTEEEFHIAIAKIIEKYLKNPDKCFSELMKLKYPGSKDSYIQLEHARFFYEKYAKILYEDIELDGDFTANCYNKNKEIFKNAHKEYKPKK